ncbi:MAG: hypothetical protein H7Y43_11380 [Akkermansiaceae bacterium]|nr:hypothetical protein [Verrucomicrobiales bacterium]
MCVGDSITAQGAYEGYVRQALDTLYPEGHIRVIDLGRGGSDAAGQLGSLRGYLADHKPTIVTVMFGVNDTRWATGDEDEKEKAYLTALSNYGDLAKEHGFQLVFLRESHFSHGQKAGEWETGLNGVLDKLLAAQNRLAKEREVPVIDTHGAYRLALAKAWKQDPLYEFTPDVVHPTSPGHAAIAAEILRACGAGLPLSKKGEARPPLRLDRASSLSVEVLDDAATVGGASITIQLRICNLTDRRVNGAIRFVLGKLTGTRTVSLEPRAEQMVPILIPTADLPGRWDAMPLYVAALADGLFSATHEFFQYSRTVDGKFNQGDFQRLTGISADKCPISEGSVALTQDGFSVDFTWKDASLVSAQTPFKDHAGLQINQPLNLNAREGQPCDAVEFFFDLRDKTSSGRWTSGADSTPTGIVRVGVYQLRENDHLVARVLVNPQNLTDSVTLTTQNEGRFLLKLATKTAGTTAGFSMRVTDNKEFKLNSGPVFHLTGKPNVGHEPMSYLRLGYKPDGLFYRVGY